MRNSVTVVSLFIVLLASSSTQISVGGKDQFYAGAEIYQEASNAVKSVDDIRMRDIPNDSDGIVMDEQPVLEAAQFRPPRSPRPPRPPSFPRPPRPPSFPRPPRPPSFPRPPRPPSFPRPPRPPSFPRPPRPPSFPRPPRPPSFPRPPRPPRFP
ncbi:hypothetical protein Aperf_G00000058159 [Anoplocephala perfoliata]